MSHRASRGPARRKRDRPRSQTAPSRWSDSRGRTHARSMKPTLAYIGLGSNVDDSAGYVREAFGALERIGRVVAISDLYLTAPWGISDQAPFVNAAAVVETTMPAPALVEALIAIEKGFGRARTVRYGPRTLDLDVLLYDELSINDPASIVPHPELHRRAFALAPLSEIAADVRVP